jgi:hypothetical protein
VLVYTENPLITFIIKKYNIQGNVEGWKKVS